MLPALRPGSWAGQCQDAIRVAVVLFSLYYGKPDLVKLFLQRGAEVDILQRLGDVGLTSRLKELLMGSLTWQTRKRRTAFRR